MPAASVFKKIQPVESETQNEIIDLMIMSLFNRIARLSEHLLRHEIIGQISEIDIQVYGLWVIASLTS